MSYSTTTEQEKEQWYEVILPQNRLLDLKLKQVWQYRDLLLMLVKRDFVSTYKQTILGPVWFLLQPLLTTLTYVLIFGNIAGISTDGLPKILFYMSGITIWNYFSECLNKTSTVFKDNSTIFGKVYFPRLVMPLSIIVSNLVRFGIQMLLFLGFLFFFVIKGDKVHPNWYIAFTPLLILLIALLALALGLIITSLTTKYRDLVFLLTFGIQLFMYATPIIYPMNSLPAKYATLIRANPLSSLVEAFRYAFTGSGQFNWMYIGYSVVCTIVLLAIGVITFNKVEKSFMDTV